MRYGYIPAPAPTSMTLPKSWFSRNWKWFIPTAVSGLVLAVALAVGALLTFVFELLKSSEPYQHAVAVASNNPEVVRELAGPVSSGWYVSGSVSVSGTSGEAELAIPLHGKVRHGTVYVVAKKTDGVWAYDKLQMLVDGDKSPIELLPTPLKPPQLKDN